MLRRAAFLTPALLLTLSFPLCAQDWARTMFTDFSHDFGSVAKNAKAEYQFVFTNKFMEDVHIASATPSCHCTRVSITNPVVKTYQQGAIVATLNSASFLGQRGATITVVIDQPYYATVQLQVAAFVRSDIVVTPENVQLGDVSQGAATEKSVAINFDSSSGWRILDIKNSNPHLHADVQPIAQGPNSVSYQLRVRLDGAASPGYLRNHLVLVTNDSASTQIPILVEGRVLSKVTVGPALLNFGVLKPGEKATRQVMVTGQTPFRIVSVRTDGNSFKVSSTADAEARPVHVIPVTIEANHGAGQVAQVIRIKTDLDGTESVLSAYLTVAPAGPAGQDERTSRPPLPELR
jgi:hypothetical protein